MRSLVALARWGWDGWDLLPFFWVAGKEGPQLSWLSLPGSLEHGIFYSFLNYAPLPRFGDRPLRIYQKEAGLSGTRALEALVGS